MVAEGLGCPDAAIIKTRQGLLDRVADLALGFQTDIVPVIPGRIDHCFELARAHRLTPHNLHEIRGAT